MNLWPMLSRSYEACVRDLSSSTPETRASALRDLSLHGVAIAGDLKRGKIGPLVEMAFSDASPLVRAEACAFLSFYFPYLSQVETDKADTSETAGEIALAALSQDTWTQKLGQAVLDPHEHVAEVALQTIGELKLRSLLGSVRKACYDDRPRVRFQAVLVFSLLEEDVQSLSLALELAMEDVDAEIRYVALRLAEEHLLISDAARLVVKKRFKNILLRRAQDPEPKVSFAAALFMAHLHLAEFRTDEDNKAEERRREVENSLSEFSSLFSFAKKRLELQLKKIGKPSFFLDFPFLSSFRKQVIPHDDLYEAICLIGALQMTEHKERLEGLFLAKSKSPHSQMLANAARTALAYFNHPEAIQSLVADLHSPILGKKEEAAWSALRLNFPSMQAHLEPLLRDQALSESLHEEIQKTLDLKK